jgi:hypothetical protein
MLIIKVEQLQLQAPQLNVTFKKLPAVSRKELHLTLLIQHLQAYSESPLLITKLPPQPPPILIIPPNPLKAKTNLSLAVQKGREIVFGKGFGQG